MSRRSAFVIFAFVAVACATTERATSPVAPPLAPSTSAYEAAARVELPKTAAENLDGLHNLYWLSDQILSGSEPESEAALQRLAEMGIKTILSVDGKAPDHETAARYGMRYVHVPIRYRGLTGDEKLAIAKTFRELPGPFFVHCFHGKHRGPAAAAVGRVVLDGAPREQAIAEMRQWCGTSSKYEGLYAAIAYDDLPSAEETENFDFDFPAQHRLGGFRHAMIEMPRSWDVVVALSKRDWKPDPAHPDASATNEAAKAHEIFVQTLQMEEVAERPDDFKRWLDESEAASEELAALLLRHDRGDAEAGERAKDVAGVVARLCSDCHTKYRND